MICETGAVWHGSGLAKLSFTHEALGSWQIAQKLIVAALCERRLSASG